MIIRPIRSYFSAGVDKSAPPEAHPASPAEPARELESPPQPFQPGPSLPPAANVPASPVRRVPVPAFPSNRKRWPTAKRRLTPF